VLASDCLTPYIALFKPDTGLFVAFPLEIVEQSAIGFGGQPPCQLVQPSEQRKQARLGFRGGHGLHRAFQLNQGLENCLFGQTHNLAYSAILAMNQAVLSEEGPESVTARCKTGRLASDLTLPWHL
jgi:hypothetical protein